MRTTHSVDETVWTISGIGTDVESERMCSIMTCSSSVSVDTDAKDLGQLEVELIGKRGPSRE